MIRLFFAQLDMHLRGYGALLRVTKGLIKSCLDFGIFHSLTKLHAEPSTALIAIVRVYEVDWDGLNSHD